MSQITQGLLRECLDALDLSQALLEKSAHHGKILRAERKLRAALARPEPVSPYGFHSPKTEKVYATAEADSMDMAGEVVEVFSAALAQPAKPVEYTYSSTQATTCAGCGKHKHTPLRIDAMDGYVCLTCIDKKLGSLLGEFGYPEPTQPEPVSPARRNRKPITVERALGGARFLPFNIQLVEDRIDEICGCKGRYDCDCVSVQNKAIGDIWYAHNSKAAAKGGAV